MRNPQVAAAVAAALSLGGFGIAQAAPACSACPTPAQASTQAHNVYIAGSSAAANAVINYLESTVFVSNFSAFTTPTSVPNQPDFRAVSGKTATGQPFAGTTLTVWYRPEGGSVVGVFPVINNSSIKELDIQNAGCSSTSTNATSAAWTCTNVGVGNVASIQGTGDTWTGATIQRNVDIGVSDLEPGVFGNPSKALSTTVAWAGGGNNDPVKAGAYASSFTGPDKGVSAVQGLTHAVPLQQVFGFVVNTSLTVTDLPKQQIAAIFDGVITDWNQITLANNTAASPTAGTAIVVCNREIGSGTRAETDLFLNHDGCVTGAASLAELAGGVIGTTSLTYPADNFQSLAEMDCVNSHANAIGYVSIDYFSKIGNTFTSVKSVSIDGIVPSAQAAATGEYDDWYELSINENPKASSDGTTFYTSMVSALENPALNAGSSTQVVAIPNIGSSSNGATTPLALGSNGVLTSDFERGAGTGGNSCIEPTHQ